MQVPPPLLPLDHEWCALFGGIVAHCHSPPEETSAPVLPLRPVSFQQVRAPLPSFTCWDDAHHAGLSARISVHQGCSQKCVDTEVKSPKSPDALHLISTPFFLHFYNEAILSISCVTLHNFVCFPTRAGISILWRNTGIFWIYIGTNLTI